uniref:Monocarboxylate transporter 9-like protein n=1 Tax=Rhipicephalus appendiculatus TaxID=34631 RepID=A0A131Z0I8_RHIAP
MNNATFVDDISEESPPQEPRNARPHMDDRPQSQKRRTANHASAPWRVAVVGGLIVLFATSMFGTSGLFYVYFMDTFGVSHEAASWPASTMAVTLNCAGLVVSLLQRFLSIFQISLLGSLLLWTSLILAAFAPNMGVMTLLFGAVHGLGLGFVENTVSVIIATSFLSNKSFAMGLKDTGRTLSVLIFPTVVSYLNSLYGIRSTLALCGALLMHVTGLVLTLRRHPFTERPALRRNRTGSEVIGTSGSIGTGRPHEEPSDNVTRIIMVNNINYGSCKNFMKAADLPNNIVRPFGAPQSPIADSEVNICTQKQAVGGVAPAPACVTSEGGSINTAQQFHAQESTGSPRSQSLRNVRVVADCFSSPAVNRPRRKSTGTSLTSDVGRPTLNENQKTAPANRTQMLLLFGDPTFYILAFQNTVMSYSSFMFRSLIVDYARDKGVPLANAELMGTYCAASDLLLGHVGLPFLADRGFVNRTLLAALTFGLLSASMFALSVSERFVSFLGIFLVQSLLISATASFSPVLVTDYLGACRVPITCGVSGLVTGPLLLATPSITGFFRDTRGSYDNLVRLIAGMAATSAILILLLRILRKK